MKALAIFRNKFRHVLVAIETGKGTVVVLDPARGLHPWAGGCEIAEVARHYREINAVVVECEATPGGSLLGLWTCVEVVKRVLGVRAFILTPHGLYKYLIRKTT